MLTPFTAAASSAALSFEMPRSSAVTISASEMQNRADGEMSTVPSLPMGVCSPPLPRTDSPSVLAISLAFFSVPSEHRFGSGMCTDARIPVPMLVGQLVTTPKSGCRAHPPSIRASTTSTAALSRSNTALSSTPFCMHMMRR